MIYWNFLNRNVGVLKLGSEFKVLQEIYKVIESSA